MLNEGKVLSKLQNVSKHSSQILNIEGIPKLFYCGSEGDFNILVVELLGKSLEKLLDSCERKLTLKCVAMIAI